MNFIVKVIADTLSKDTDKHNLIRAFSVHSTVRNNSVMNKAPNIGIKHGFSCINICQVRWEVLKTEAEGDNFQHLQRDLANVNALKNHVRSLLLHKKLKTFATFRFISCTILFCLFQDVT